MTIKDIMQNDFIPLKATDTVEDALKIMTDNKVNGLPVVNDDNLLVGMVVKADIYRFLIQPGHYKVSPIDWVMAKKVISAPPDETVSAAAKKLLDHHIIAMPVVVEGKVLGMISIEDLLKYYSQA
ncbi:MAG: CBS domain-containing protein [Syntrophomonadaceae bacterium]|nr:CBS domain-containing protein [Syntrophomonadaceae bacterium]